MWFDNPTCYLELEKFQPKNCSKSPWASLTSFTGYLGIVQGLSFSLCISRAIIALLGGTRLFDIPTFFFRFPELPSSLTISLAFMFTVSISWKNRQFLPIRHFPLLNLKQGFFPASIDFVSVIFTCCSSIECLDCSASWNGLLNTDAGPDPTLRLGLGSLSNRGFGSLSSGWRCSYCSCSSVSLSESSSRSFSVEKKFPFSKNLTWWFSSAFSLQITKVKHYSSILNYQSSQMLTFGMIVTLCWLDVMGCLICFY